MSILSASVTTPTSDGRSSTVSRGKGQAGSLWGRAMAKASKGPRAHGSNPFLSDRHDLDQLYLGLNTIELALLQTLDVVYPSDTG
jgi:hypothetical protein